MSANRHPHWRVSVETSGEQIVAIDPEMLAGREISEADEDAIRTAAHHLLAFIGDAPPQTNSVTLFETNDVLHGQRPKDLAALIGDFESSSIDGPTSGHQLSDYLAGGANGFFVGKFVGEKFGPITVLFEGTSGADVEVVPGHATSMQLPAQNFAKTILFPTDHQLPPQMNTTGVDWSNANDPAVKLFVQFDVEDYVDQYELRGDEGDYSPNDEEKTLLIDAIYGVVSNLHEKLRKIIPSRPSPENHMRTSVSRDEALKFLGIATRNWDHISPLSEDDIGDVATALLWFANQSHATTKTVPPSPQTRAVGSEAAD